MALFAEELTRQLDRSGIPRQEIARMMGIHKQMLWLLQAGKRLPTPEMVELVGNVLQLSPAARKRLHRFAAHDRGYRL